MKYRALESFVGNICMAKGEEREIANEEIAKDLVGAKYIEPVEQVKKGSRSKKNES